MKPFDVGPTNDATDNYTIKATVSAGTTNFYYAADNAGTGGGMDPTGVWTQNAGSLLTGGINILIDGIKSTEERDSLMG